MIFMYATAAFSCLVVAFVELLSRYGTGNRPRWILFGLPQTAYYVVNALAGIVALFVSETLGYSTIAKTYEVNVNLAIIDSVKAGIFSMFALRSSLYSVEKKNSSARFDLGPAQILNIINRYLDRKMDQNRGKQALNEVASIVADFEPNLLELFSICAAVPEAIPKEDIDRLRTDVQALIKEKNISAGVKAITMGLRIQKEVGTGTLSAGVEILRKRSRANRSAPDQSDETAEVPARTIVPDDKGTQDEGMVSLDEDLDATLAKLSEAQDSSGRATEGGNDVR